MEKRRQKEFLVVVIAALLSLLTFFVAALVLPEPTAVLLGVLAALSIAWALIMAVCLGLADHWSSAVVATLLPAVSVAVAGRLAAGALVGSALLLIALTLSRRTVRREITARITFRTAEVFAPALKLIVFGLILALAGLMLPVLERSLIQGEVVLTTNQVEALTYPLAPIIASFSPGVTPESTIDELIDQQLEKELPSGTQVTAQAREQIRQQVGEQLATRITGKESLNDVIAKQINTWLQSFTATSPLLFSLSIIVILLLAVRAFVPLVAWVLLPLLALLVWLGRKIELWRITEQTVVSEQLSF